MLKEGSCSRRETDPKKEREAEKSVSNRKERAKTTHKAWGQEARKAKKAGKNKKAQKKRKKSFFIHDVSTTY